MAVSSLTPYFSNVTFYSKHDASDPAWQDLLRPPLPLLIDVPLLHTFHIVLHLQHLPSLLLDNVQYRQHRFLQGIFLNETMMSLGAENDYSNHYCVLGLLFQVFQSVWLGIEAQYSRVLILATSMVVLVDAYEPMEVLLIHQIQPTKTYPVFVILLRVVCSLG